MNAPESRHVRFISLLGNPDRRAVVSFTSQGCFHHSGVDLEIRGGPAPRARVKRWTRRSTEITTGDGTLDEHDLERLDGMLDLFFVCLGVSTTMETISIKWYDGDELVGIGSYADSFMPRRDTEHVLQVTSLAHRLITGEEMKFPAMPGDRSLPDPREIRAKRAEHEARERAHRTQLVLGSLRDSEDARTNAREIARRIATGVPESGDQRTESLDRTAAEIRRWVFAQAPRGDRPHEPGFGLDLKCALEQLPGVGPTFYTGPEHLDEGNFIYYIQLAPVDWHAIATEVLEEL